MPKSSDPSTRSSKAKPTAALRSAPAAAEGTAGARECSRSITADQVAWYLRRHPDFLSDHPALLGDLDPPKRQQGDGVLDLQHAMLLRLRHDVRELTHCRDELLATGRSNLVIQNRVHKAVLALLEADSFEQFIETITTDLAIILGLDLVMVCVEFNQEDGVERPVAGIMRLPSGQVDRIFGPGGQVRLRDDIDGDETIFGEASGLIRSDAVIRLNISAKAPSALLALGSRDKDHFHAGQGTELLSFLARVLESSCRKWLGLSAP